MDPHQHWPAGIYISLDQGKMACARNDLLVGAKLEITPFRGKIRFGNAFDDFLIPQTVFYEALDADHGKPVRFDKFSKIGQTCHGTVSVHNFTDDPGRRLAGHAGKINARLGLASSDEHAAVARAQRKGMARTHNISRAGLGIYKDFNCMRTVLCRYAGGYASTRINGNGESGPKGRLVIGCHHGQVEPVEQVSSHGRANEAPAVFCHEVYFCRGNGVSGTGKVALVFAVFVVSNDDNVSSAIFAERQFNRRKRVFQKPCSRSLCSVSGPCRASSRLSTYFAIQSISILTALPMPLDPWVVCRRVLGISTRVISLFFFMAMVRLIPSMAMDPFSMQYFSSAWSIRMVR